MRAVVRRRRSESGWEKGRRAAGFHDGSCPLPRRARALLGCAEPSRGGRRRARRPVLSEGWHSRAGEDHAEIVALDRAGGASRGATLYVTLEPCNHYGRTPPCVEAILRAGISRVVVGHLDPDPRMRGRSVRDPARGRRRGRCARRPCVRVAKRTVPPPHAHRKAVRPPQARHHPRRQDRRRPVVTAGGLRAKTRGCGPTSSGPRPGRYWSGRTPYGRTTLCSRPGIFPCEPPRITRVVLDPHLTISPESKLAKSAGEAPVVVFAHRVRARRS